LDDYNKNHCLCCCDEAVVATCVEKPHSPPYLSFWYLFFLEDIMLALLQTKNTPAGGAAAGAPRPTLLKDYKPSAFLIDHVQLDVQIGAAVTTICNTMQMKQNPAAKASRTLELNCECQD